MLGRLKGPPTCLEIEKHVLHCLKPGKSRGPDKCPNKLVKTMTDEELLIVQAWVNDILKKRGKNANGAARQKRATMNGA